MLIYTWINKLANIKKNCGYDASIFFNLTFCRLHCMEVAHPLFSSVNGFAKIIPSLIISDYAGSFWLQLKYPFRALHRLRTEATGRLGFVASLMIIIIIISTNYNKNNNAISLVTLIIPNRLIGAVGIDRRLLYC